MKSITITLPKVYYDELRREAVRMEEPFTGYLANGLNRALLDYTIEYFAIRPIFAKQRKRVQIYKVKSDVEEYIKWVAREFDVSVPNVAAQLLYPVMWRKTPKTTEQLNGNVTKLARIW